MKYKLTVACFVFLGLVTGFGLVTPRHANAESFNQNRIIDDAVFDNANSMTATQIDAFLNSFPSSCISTNNKFSAPNPTGYTPTGGYTYGSNVSAGTVIYNASQAYGLNPQVLLATLQKEQSLVTGAKGCYPNTPDPAKSFPCDLYGNGTTYNCTDACPWSYGGGCVNIAVGYGCPSYCNADQEGFTKQIIRATWLLKFGEQRSKGNVDWAVVEGAWDNSDDPQSCYGGPMTQGTWSRGPSQCGATTYYDGYKTISNSSPQCAGLPTSVSVHMETGATAALYWYTPFICGNYSFYNIFTGWFGSTQFPQPIGGQLLYQSSTGKLYLVTDSSRFYIPNWDTMVNYKLDGYRSTPVSDTTLQAYTDGGTLTNLIYDSDGVFLINNGMRHHVSGAMCTAWGLSCFDNSVVKSIGTTFATQYLQLGGELTETSIQGSVLYKMANGSRLPVANNQTKRDLGLDIPTLVSSTINSGQPLGPLLLTTPGAITFSPSLTRYYFDGAQYYVATSPSDWTLDRQPQITPPTSLYNSTPPPSTILGSWVSDSSGSKFIIDQGRKILIPGSLQSVWSTQTFTSAPTGLFANLTPLTLNKTVYTDGVYQLWGDKKHHVPTWDAYLALGITNSQTTVLSIDKLATVPQGNDALGDGNVITLQGDNYGVYVINGGKTTHVATYDALVGYGLKISSAMHYPTSILDDYPMASSPLNGSYTGNTSYVVGPGSLYSLSDTEAIDFGLIKSRLQQATNGTLQSAHISRITKFLYNQDNGRIYYASGGAIHYVGSYNAFYAYGGTRTQATVVTTDTLENFTEQQAVY